LRTVVYLVEDLEGAKRWYADVLEQAPYFDTPFYVGFDVGGYELGLHPADPNAPKGVGGTGAYWAVSDADRAVERLVAKGARVAQEVQDVGGGIRLGTVVDPFGNLLGVIRNPEFRAEVGARISATGAELSDRVVVKEVAVGAPPPEVWRLWTTAEGIRSWLLPDCTVELRVGGPFELYFLAETEAPGRQGGEGNRFLAFLPPRLLTFTWNAPPELPKTRPHKTWVILELEPVPAGTRLRLTHTGWPSAGLADAASEWPATFAYFESAWGQVFAALQRHLGPPR
jgi:uncharacterized protein YndB with AHSA1/START domain/predicted enzyme related to lactoylglutathione lyase